MPAFDIAVNTAFAKSPVAERSRSIIRPRLQPTDYCYEDCTGVADPLPAHPRYKRG